MFVTFLSILLFIITNLYIFLLTKIQYLFKVDMYDKVFGIKNRN